MAASSIVIAAESAESTCARYLGSTSMCETAVRIVPRVDAQTRVEKTIVSDGAWVVTSIASSGSSTRRATLEGASRRAASASASDTPSSSARPSATKASSGSSSAPSCDQSSASSGSSARVSVPGMPAFEASHDRGDQIVREAQPALAELGQRGRADLLDLDLGLAAGDLAEAVFADRRRLREEAVQGDHLFGRNLRGVISAVPLPRGAKLSNHASRVRRATPAVDLQAIVHEATRFHPITRRAFFVASPAQPVGTQRSPAHRPQASGAHPPAHPP